MVNELAPALHEVAKDIVVMPPLQPNEASIAAKPRPVSGISLGLRLERRRFIRTDCGKEPTMAARDMDRAEGESLASIETQHDAEGCLQQWLQIEDTADGHAAAR